MREGWLSKAQMDAASTLQWFSAWLTQQRCFLGETVLYLTCKSLQPFRDVSTSACVLTQRVSAAGPLIKVHPCFSPANCPLQKHLDVGDQQVAAIGLPWRRGYARRRFS